MALRIKNKAARRLWLDTNSLSMTPTGSLDVLQIIKNLGFVQLDTIQYVSRAHHHILWSRNQNYREGMLDKLLSRDRAVFEHFTHDASILPMEFYPMWRRQFSRMAARVQKSGYYRTPLSNTICEEIRARIEKEGPLSTHAFDTRVTGEKKMWSRPPHKLALDQMWYAGELSTSHRESFKKFYDLSERIIPPELLEIAHEEDAQINWLCSEALNRLGFGSLGDIQRFWAATDRAEVQIWAEQNSNKLIPVEIEDIDGNWMNGFAPLDIEDRLNAAPVPTSRLRILNPFDPAIRDRARLAKLFGFHYRIEIFVPAKKRKWGYYVYPLLEGDRFVGRIEVKADRKSSSLKVIQFWPEPGVKWPQSRKAKLAKELERLARFTNLNSVNWL
ncbi:winged helix DNA-binding domain-containing protein [Sneathiella marina]|uniref:Winged helix DNA-binding domain-containing protein n=1 Tax=Sneathiella marina TaxID=2950108 RepID=A0ABY4W631_9PROT|nr:crosslink repair DNA glycosylase YcaQ family protein [Sneathiella marina]USG61583.1 winged helix DNA-binding domain-containing protein [Sneathiella marina]